jgi:hypothetical protein
VQPLFRYFSERNAKAFVEKGEVLFRALSYFRDYEDEGVRADPHEGTLVHLPKDGLQVTKVDTGEVVELPHRFESTAREDEIFVYCMSTELSNDIGNRFMADVVVEILEPVKFLALVRSSLSLRKRLQAAKLTHGQVRYYEWHEPPIVDWALPERIAMRKPKPFEWQKEYRIAVPSGDAFDVQNVGIALVNQASARPSRVKPHPVILLKLGRLSKFCRVHKLRS